MIDDIMLLARRADLRREAARIHALSQAGNHGANAGPGIEHREAEREERLATYRASTASLEAAERTHLRLQVTRA